MWDILGLLIFNFLPRATLAGVKLVLSCQVEKLISGNRWFLMFGSSFLWVECSGEFLDHSSPSADCVEEM